MAQIWKLQQAVLVCLLTLIQGSMAYKIRGSSNQVHIPEGEDLVLNCTVPDFNGSNEKIAWKFKGHLQFLGNASKQYDPRITATLNHYLYKLKIVKTRQNDGGNIFCERSNISYLHSKVVRFDVIIIPETITTSATTSQILASTTPISTSTTSSKLPTRFSSAPPKHAVQDDISSWPISVWYAIPTAMFAFICLCGLFGDSECCNRYSLRTRIHIQTNSNETRCEESGL